MLNRLLAAVLLTVLFAIAPAHAQLANGTYLITKKPSSITIAVDGGFGYYGVTPAVQAYPINTGTGQQWTWNGTTLQNVYAGSSGSQAPGTFLTEASNGTATESISGDTFTLTQSGTSACIIKDNRTGHFLGLSTASNQNGTGFALRFGTTQTPWTIGAGCAGAPPPPPTTSLSVNPSTITAGQSSTLLWSSTNSTRCTGTNFTVNGVSGTATVTPTATTTYSVQCSGVTSPSASASVTVTVDPAVPTVSLSVNPSTITAGQSSTLTWNSTNTNSCVGTNFTTTGLNDSVTVNPPVTTMYTVQCSGAVNPPASASATVTVTTQTPVFGPMASIGWHLVDPGGHTLVVATSAMTIADVRGIVDVVGSGPATFDVYKVANGQPCSSSGTKINTTPFDATIGVGSVVVAPLSTVTGALSIGINDRLCVLTSGSGWSAPGKAYVQVTFQ